MTEKLPPQQESIPGPTYENPNEDQTYIPPEEDSGEDTTDEPKAPSNRA